jgi:V/A-type H+-transporting ATPase subunit C
VKDGLLFANAVAKSKENGLFKSERLDRMIDAENLDTAVKILVESDYGNGTLIEDPADFDKILDAEAALLPEFIRSISVEGVGIECFFLRDDYFNLKALLKAKYGSGQVSYPHAKGGLIPFEVMKDAIQREKPPLPQFMVDAITEIETTFETTKSPRFLDECVDKAMFSDIACRLSKKGVDSKIRQYFSATADFINISSFVRSARINADITFFLSGFVVAGTLDETFFSSIYPDCGVLSERLRSGIYDKFTDFVKTRDLASFDRERDNYLIDIFREKRDDMFSTAPVVGYYLAKRSEISTLRMMLVCIKNDVSRDEIRKRLRTLYA